METTVTFCGRTFELKEPDTGVIMTIINVIGDVGMRSAAKMKRVSAEVGSTKSESDFGDSGAENGDGTQAQVSAAEKLMKDPMSLAAMFAFMSELTERDIFRLGIAVLQIRDSKDDCRWFKQNMRLSAVIDAFFINMALSTEIVEVFKSFLRSAAAIGEIGKTMGMIGEAATGGQVS